MSLTLDHLDFLASRVRDNQTRHVETFAAMHPREVIEGLRLWMERRDEERELRKHIV